MDLGNIRVSVTIGGRGPPCWQLHDPSFSCRLVGRTGAPLSRSFGRVGSGHGCGSRGFNPSCTWDPEGLFPPVSGGHFSRKAGLQHSKSGQLPLRILGIPADIDKGEGMLVSDLIPEEAAALRQRLEEKYMPVDLVRRGLRIHSLDPPIFTIPDFAAPDLCDSITASAEASGLMQASKIGAGNAMGMNAINMRRTSTTLLVTPDVVNRAPDLQAPVLQLQSAILGLLLAGDGKQWGQTGKLPLPTQTCFEQLQIACYAPGQHFLSHEDAFPEMVAEQNGFQRRATLLVYLNDAPGGGATLFDALDVAVQPMKGRALLFFPAFADGLPDERTLHTAEDAGAMKWIAQQWIASGWGAAPNEPTQPGLRAEDEEEVLDQVLVRGRRGKGKKAAKDAKPPKKGFGGFV
eukprot:jgi/Botrbrau1/9459/Bobra.0252s0080.1